MVRRTGNQVGGSPCLPTLRLTLPFRFMALDTLPADLSKIPPDTFHGVARIWTESGQLTINDHYVIGKFCGELITWKKNNSVLLNPQICRSKYTYCNGILRGPFLKWYPNGTVWLQGLNLKGLIHGIFNEYTDESLQVFKTNYAYGEELWSKLAFET